MRAIPFTAPLLLAAVVLGSAAAADGAPGPADTTRTVSVNGMQMFYRTVGTGDPLLLLHGGTQSGAMWDPFVEALAGRYQVIIPDLRGHGSSTNPDGPLATRRFADDVIALLDHLKIGRCRAIGASAGGMTLAHLVMKHPERIEALVLVGVGTDLPKECRAILARTSADDLSETAWQSLRARHRHGDAQIRALYAWVASLARDDGDLKLDPAQLGRITAPMLIVHGDRDYCYPASMAWEIYRATPASYLWVVPNGSHVPLSGANAATFTATVLDFLLGNWRPR